MAGPCTAALPMRHVQICTSPKDNQPLDNAAALRGLAFARQGKSGHACALMHLEITVKTHASVSDFGQIASFLLLWLLAECSYSLFGFGLCTYPITSPLSGACSSDTVAWRQFDCLQDAAVQTEAAGSEASPAHGLGWPGSSQDADRFWASSNRPIAQSGHSFHAGLPLPPSV